MVIFLICVATFGNVINNEYLQGRAAAAAATSNSIDMSTQIMQQASNCSRINPSNKSEREKYFQRKIRQWTQVPLAVTQLRPSTAYLEEGEKCKQGQLSHKIFMKKRLSRNLKEFLSAKQQKMILRSMPRTEWSAYTTTKTDFFYGKAR